MSADAPVPLAVSQAVDRWIDSELSDARRYDNRQPLDESGAWSLHRLVAESYARGWSDGSQVGEDRSRERRNREKEVTS